MRSNTATITVKVGRFGSETVEVEANDGDTIKDVLEKAGIVLSSSESVFFDGERAQLTDEPEDGDFINIVGSKEGGAR